MPINYWQPYLLVGPYCTVQYQHQPANKKLPYSLIQLKQEPKNSQAYRPRPIAYTAEGFGKLGIANVSVSQSHGLVSLESLQISILSALRRLQLFNGGYWRSAREILV